MVIRIKKSYFLLFILIVMLTIGGLYIVNKRPNNNIGKNLNNKSSFYKEVMSENVEMKSDEELESTAFSIAEKLNLDLGEPVDTANSRAFYGEGYNYDLIFSKGNIQLNENTGELISIAVDSKIEEEKSILTEEELIKKASEYYNILSCPSDYKITKQEDLGEDYYNVVWEKYYDGEIYSKYESVSMVLNKNDGSINKVTVSNVPNITDKSKETINKEDAEKTAKAFKDLDNYSYSGEIKKDVIVPNTNYLSDDFETASFSKIAWIAKLKNSEGEEAYIYIDTMSGDILGGKID